MVIVPFFNIYQIHPDLIALVILSWSLASSLDETLPWAFVGGLILDLSVSTPFGIFTIGLLTLAVSANLWQSRSFGSPILMHVLLALPYLTLYNLIILALLHLFAYPIIWGDALSRVIFPSSLVNTLVMALVAPSVLRVIHLIRGNELRIDPI